MSALMRHFLAGVLEKLPECMALYAPVINSYKRYVEGTWAPLNTTWGMDNRTCAVRIINVNRDAIRLYERMGFVRVPEFDFHPAPEVVVMAYRLDLR
jgi:glutamine synthetase